MWPCVLEQMQLPRRSVLWCLNWSITNVPWWYRLRTFTSETSTGFVKRKWNFILNSLHWLSQSIWKWKELFAHPPWHSDIYKAQSSYKCVFTFITLFAPQLPAGRISLVGSEKKKKQEWLRNRASCNRLLLICYNLKFKKRTNNKQKTRQTKTNKKEKKRATTNIAIKNLFVARPER